jgi:hypothetical protein
MNVAPFVKWNAWVNAGTAPRLANGFATLHKDKSTLAWKCSVSVTCERLFGNVMLIMLFGELGVPLVLRWPCSVPYVFLHELLSVGTNRPNTTS